MKYELKNKEVYLNKETLENLFKKYVYHVNVYPYDDIPDEGGQIEITKYIPIEKGIYLVFQFYIPYENKDGDIIPTKNLSIDEPEGYVHFYKKNNIQYTYEEVRLFDSNNKERIYPESFFDMSNYDLLLRIK